MSIIIAFILGLGIGIAAGGLTVWAYLTSDFS